MAGENSPKKSQNIKHQELKKVLLTFKGIVISGKQWTSLNIYGEKRCQIQLVIFTHLFSRLNVATLT